MFSFAVFRFFHSAENKARFSGTRGLIYISGSLDVYVFLPAVGPDSRSLLDCRRADMGDSLRRNVLKESDRILSGRSFLRRTLIGPAQAALTTACCDPEVCSASQSGDECSCGEQICSVTVGEKGGNLVASSFSRRLCRRLAGETFTAFLWCFPRWVPLKEPRRSRQDVTNMWSNLPFNMCSS